MTVFAVAFESVYLSVEDVWPDGDAPENPTAEHVAHAMREYGGKFETLRNWDLVTEVTVDGIKVWP